MSKEPAGSERVEETRSTREEGMASGVVHGNEMITPLTGGTQITVDIEDFEYKYKCTHCGHQWSEMHVEEFNEPR